MPPLPLPVAPMTTKELLKRDHLAKGIWSKKYGQCMGFRCTAGERRRRENTRELYESSGLCSTRNDNAYVDCVHSQCGSSTSVTPLLLQHIHLFMLRPFSDARNSKLYVHKINILKSTAYLIGCTGIRRK